MTLLSLFALVHGARRYGWRGITVFFLLGVVVANVFENLSIATGFPFGPYHHTAAMGPKLFLVPWIIGPIFAAAGYFGWVLAGILLGEVFGTPRAGLVWARPLVAAFITTAWDFCVDPIGGTVNRDWIWAAGGAWYGVPWLNYFGWLLTMWTIFQLFACYLARGGGTVHTIPARGAYWWQPLVQWTLIALQFPLLAVLVPDAVLSDASGATWSMRALFEAMALASVFTMLFTCLLAAVLLVRARE